MKRRKKLWIACAALGVVLALCAVALFWRPAPYRFLRDAELADSWTKELTLYNLSTSIPSSGTGSYETVQRYRLDSVWGRVVEQAELELTPERGWTRDPRPSGPADFSSGEETISIALDQTGDGQGPDIIWVTISHPATPLERFFNWIRNR